MCDIVNEVILLAREADEYMIRGKPDKAKPLYLKGAEMLREISLSDKSPYEQAEHQYSEAVLFFKGGEYYKSYSTAVTINFLFVKHIEGSAELYLAAKEKSSNNYKTETLTEIYKREGAMSQGDKESCKIILYLLRDNPYLISSSRMTKMRYDALMKLGRPEAELFKDDIEVNL